MSLIGLEGWWMAPSQMGMWQGSLEVFCGAVLNKKSSLPTKKKKKKRGLDLRSPNTVASPSSIMAFNTFLYTPELHINIHPDTTAAPASPSDSNSNFHIIPADTCCHVWSTFSNCETSSVITFFFQSFFFFFFSSHSDRHSNTLEKTQPVWIFWWRPLLLLFFFFFFPRWQPYFFGVCLWEEGTVTKGGK